MIFSLLLKFLTSQLFGSGWDDRPMCAMTSSHFMGYNYMYVSIAAIGVMNNSISLSASNTSYCMPSQILGMHCVPIAVYTYNIWYISTSIV